MLIKQYAREERFTSEVRALLILGPHGLSPQAKAVCAEHRTLLMTRTEGRPLREVLLGGRDDERIAAQLGQIVRRLHQVPAPCTGPLGAPSPLPWTEFLTAHLQMRITTLPVSPRDADRLWEWLEKRLARLLPLDNPRMLHHDLKPANLLRMPGGSLRLCDFDQARGGDPLSDLGKLWWRTFATQHTGPWRAFSRAYGLEPEAEEPILFYLVVHCVGALAYWHDNARPSYFRHARAATLLLAQHTGVHCPLTVRRAEKTKR
ncbi:aminoglycoside phosphotransferase family protein [Streptomyces sp. TRM66268-LWL]|uniref:Aminoglycoside phosphotransferase family protein n=1 Tax=Streptomyces polyasparticus TaxID=2767826 RepID=A0ABR7STL0_9ACTN|nr:aminoglycoside phosphotransferase family protein [Streptomyces polyasparticus]